MHDDPEWDGQKAIEEVSAALRDQPEETSESLAVRELERSFPLAVRSLVNIALHSSDDKLRRLASLDLLNANVKIREVSKDATGELERFLRDVTGDA